MELNWPINVSVNARNTLRLPNYLGVALLTCTELKKHLQVCLFSPAARVNSRADVTFVFQEALRYFNETTKQKEMLEFALNYLQTDDEVCCYCCYKTVMVENIQVALFWGQQQPHFKSV